MRSTAVTFDGDESKGVPDLKDVNELVIHQVLSVTEALIGWDKLNKYEMWDGQTGKQVFFAHENPIHCCIRNCFSGNREFGMPFKDSQHIEQFRLNKTRAIAQPSCMCDGCGSCWSKFCCGCGFEQGVLTNLTGNFDPVLKKVLNFCCQVVVGGNNRFKVEQFADRACGRPHYTIKDLESEEVVYEIRRDDLCTVAICCNDVVYELYGKSFFGDIMYKLQHDEWNTFNSYSISLL